MAPKTKDETPEQLIARLQNEVANYRDREANLHTEMTSLRRQLNEASELGRLKGKIEAYETAMKYSHQEQPRGYHPAMFMMGPRGPWGY